MPPNRDEQDGPPNAASQARPGHKEHTTKKAAASTSTLEG